MAVAAETYIEIADYMSPPESEVYGRSLSTIRRLGALMAWELAPDIITAPEADQARAEFYTSVEEGFGTDMELGGGLEVRDFDFRPVFGGRTMAKDLKTPVSDMTAAGLICGIETAKKDSRFLPQLTRSKWDHENAVIVDSMARGETDYNTRIVISPFPEEAAQESGAAYWRNIGYVPHLKRGFVQLYHATENGVIAGSLSFDGSNKERLREVFKNQEVDIPETETTDNWLQYAVTATLSESEAKELATQIADRAGDPKYEKTTNTVDVTREYGAIMDNVFNDSYIHVCESLYRGYQTPKARELIAQFANNAHNFNTRYATALYKMRASSEQFTNDDSAVLHELLVYSTIEMMRAQHLKKEVRAVQTDVLFLQSLDPVVFQSMLSGYGAEGARNNRTYSACGLSISLGESPDTASSESPQNAFAGNGINSESSSPGGEDKYGPLEFRCKYGHWNKRPRGKLITQCRVKSCKKSVAC